MTFKLSPLGSWVASNRNIDLESQIHNCVLFLQDPQRGPRELFMDVVRIFATDVGSLTDGCGKVLVRPPHCIKGKPYGRPRLVCFLDMPCSWEPNQNPPNRQSFGGAEHSSSMHRDNAIPVSSFHDHKPSRDLAVDRAPSPAFEETAMHTRRR